jgi:hypothetical protein
MGRIDRISRTTPGADAVVPILPVHRRTRLEREEDEEADREDARRERARQPPAPDPGPDGPPSGGHVDIRA